MTQEKLSVKSATCVCLLPAACTLGNFPKDNVPKSMRALPLLGVRTKLSAAQKCDLPDGDDLKEGRGTGAFRDLMPRPRVQKSTLLLPKLIETS